jgi:branched-chain amino acid transport system substrate-binding protein
MKSKSFLLASGIVLLLVLIHVSFLPGRVAAASSEPIIVGVLVPQTGPFTELGNQVKRGLTLAFEEEGWKIAGRDVKIIAEDTEGKPPVALQKVRKLVESDHVTVLAGVVQSPEAIALRGYVNEQKIPIIITLASADAITQENASRYLFRTSYSSKMKEAPLADYVYKKLGIRTVYVVAADFVAGHERSGWFKRTFEKFGGKIVGESFPPIGNTDFAPYLSKIKDADATYTFLPGSDAIQFVKQYDEYGVKKRVPTIIGSGIFLPYQLEAQKDAALGSIAGDIYSVALQTPENQKFVKAYQKMQKGAIPDEVVEGAYIGGQVIIEGIKNVKGNTKDVPKLLNAFKKLKLKVPRGSFMFDDKQNAVSNVYIEKVVKKDGRYTVELLETYKDVNQDWNP